MIDATWPKSDPTVLEQNEIEMVVQINGKLRGKITVTKNTKQKQIENQAVEDEKVKRYLEGKTIKKIIVIPERLVNIVVS